MRLILASKSPRRKELLGMLNLEYEVIVSKADETLEEGITIEEQAKRLSYIKARTVFEQTTGSAETIMFHIPNDHLILYTYTHNDRGCILTKQKGNMHILYT